MTGEGMARIERTGKQARSDPVRRMPDLAVGRITDLEGELRPPGNGGPGSRSIGTMTCRPGPAR